MTEQKNIDWKKAYSTWVGAIATVAGALVLGVQHFTESGQSLPTWVVPALGAVVVVARALPQGEK
jgi:hypothetical protein